MPTLVEHVDSDRLTQAIRQDLVPSHAAIRAAEAVDAALAAYRAPSLEARRLAEEAAGAVKESLSILGSVVFPVVVPRRPPPRQVAPPPIAAPPPPFDLLALAPLGCALAALPLQGGPLSTMLVLAAAAGSGVTIWRIYLTPRPVAAPLPVYLPPEPPPPQATLEPEAVVAAVRRALGQIDDLVAYAERRRIARAEPSTLNDATLEFLQDLAEAALRSRAEFALAKIEFRLPVVLEACDLTAVEYSPATARHFDIDGDAAQAVTRRPALLAGERCLKRGLAASRPGRGL